MVKFMHVPVLDDVFELFKEGCQIDLCSPCAFVIVGLNKFDDLCAICLDSFEKFEVILAAHYIIIVDWLKAA
jgi:hypothetical protein